MKVFLMTDLEGICGVDSIDMIEEETPGYRRAQELLMAETNAAIAGAARAGAETIFVFDGHGGGENFLPDRLDPRAAQTHSLSAEVLNGVGAFLSVGCHAMAGTQAAFLDHTQSSVRWFEYRINGAPFGEIGQDAAWCGANGVPFVMVSGDRAACDEARALIPGIACAQVKTADGRNRSQSIPQQEALRLVEQAAYDGICRAHEILPLRLALPAQVQLTFCRNDYCDEAAAGHPEYRRNSRTIAKQMTVLRDFRDLFF